MVRKQLFNLFFNFNFSKIIHASICAEKDQSDPSLEALRKKIIEYKTRSKTLKIQLAPAKATSDKALKEKETVQLT